jgi:hypothetical protein
MGIKVQVGFGSLNLRYLILNIDCVIEFLT